MKKRVAIVVLALFMLSLFSTMAFAENDLDKVNKGKGKVIQENKELTKANKELTKANKELAKEITKANKELTKELTKAIKKFTKAKKAIKAKIQVRNAVYEFNDVKYDWAREEVAAATVKGFVYGYEDFTFRPNAPVTNMETIVLILRAEGLEDEAQNYKLSGEQAALLKKIPDWGKNYVAVALENGILKQEELQTFNPQQGAKRYEICMYMARVLEDDATVSNTVYNQDKIFIDEDQIPQLNRKDARLLWMNEIIKGYPDGSFNPMRVVKRNEVCVMLNKLDENCLQASASSMVTGTIKEMTAIAGGYAITVQNENGETTVVNTNAQTKLFYEGKLITSIDLSKSTSVKILLGQNKEAVLVRITDAS
ncbi:MAG: S-layer homology domain-containing protein [Syntrophomonas sp.]